MDDTTPTIAALERILLTVEAELVALHVGEPVDTAELDRRLQAELTGVGSPVAAQPPPQPTFAVATPGPPPPPPPPPSVSPPLPPPPSPTLSSRPSASVPAGSRGTLEWLFRVGGIALVVLAAVFFVSTAISRGWIGPTAQLALATAVSLGIVGQSFRFPDAQRAWRVTMAAGGAAAFFVTGVVGHLGLDLLGIGAAVAWLAAAIGGFLVLARAHDSELIAALGGPAAGLGAVLVAGSADVSDAVLLAVGVGWTAALAFAAAGQRWFIARAVGGVVGATVILFGVGLSVDDSVTALSIAGGALGVASIV